MSRVLSIGATEAVGNRLFEKWIRQFSEKYPLVPFNLYRDPDIPFGDTLLLNAVLSVEEGLGCALQ